MKEVILTHPAFCTGCRACEAACAFRETQAMDPSRSCISVRKNEATGGFEILIAEGCDACRGRETPFCLEVCRPRALSLGRRRG